jgi:hypothetical protein
VPPRQSDSAAQSKRTDHGGETILGRSHTSTLSEHIEPSNDPSSAVSEKENEFQNRNIRQFVATHIARYFAGTKLAEAYTVFSKGRFSTINF